jgi:Mu-like prophage major head subunit gpT
MPEIMERRVDAAMVTRDLSTRPTSWNAENRTIDVVFTTGARGTQFSWERWSLIDEELATDASNVRLDRMNNGAPVLNTHNRYELDDQIGVVVPGSARMEGGEGIATLQLSMRDDLNDIANDIGAGIIRNLSVGYQVFTYEVEEREGQRPLYRAVDWEPCEVSFVPVPLDPGAQTRSRETAQGGHPCIVRRTNAAPTEIDMTQTATTRAENGGAAVENATTVASEPAATVEPAAVQERGLPRFTATQATAFVTEARAFGVTVETRANDLVAQNERGEISVDAARAAVMTAAADAQRAATGSIATTGRAISVGSGNADASRAAIASALAARCLGTAPTDDARPFMGMRMLEMARERAGLPASERDPYVILRAANTNSDFALLLEAAGNKVLMGRYTLANPTYQAIARQRNLTDFKLTKLLRVGDFPTLMPYQEDGEIKAGTINEGRETVILGSYGRILRLTRQAIVNDDLGAFDDVFGSIGLMVARFENTMFWTTKAANGGNGPKLADGVNLFNATGHGNLAAAGAAIDVSTVGAGRAAMRKQKDLDGNALNIAPKTLVVGPDQETLAEQFLTPFSATKVADVNRFGERLSLLVDAQITGNSWELYADPAELPTFHYGYLADAPGPRVMTEESFSVDGVAFRVIEDFYVGVTDFRGAYRNPGQ